ncbi:MAG TPA: RNA 2',3'-cyclic phosphodiesterase [Clostridia bacterium]|nr:RNA 2',3'-cyclic phosphodiesterase [Clostridia bacterium]
MRLFIAINFDNETKQKLLTVQKELRLCANGNFTRPENLHLTILFLGEVKDFSAVKKSIDTHFNSPIKLCFDKVGKFGNNLYWVGIKQNKNLKGLYLNMCNDLISKGYDIDCSRDFNAHITLARQLVFSKQPSFSFDVFSITAKCVSLMKSERIDGGLTYTEIYKKQI